MMAPTLFQVIGDALLYALFLTLEFVPVYWLLPEYAGMRRQAVAVRVYGNPYFWYERMKGRI